MFPHCGRRIMVITRASQARDAGSIPVARSIAISNVAISGVFLCSKSRIRNLQAKQCLFIAKQVDIG